MGDAGICRHCRGRGTKWTGGPPPKVCWYCKGTGLIGSGSDTSWRNPDLKRTR